MEGGNDTPYVKRNLINTPAMFSYPTKQTPDPDADPSNHGVPVEEPTGPAISKEVIDASKAKEAKVAEVEKKEEEALAKAP